MPIVKCSICKEERVELSHEQLRRMVDAGRLPVCDRHGVDKGQHRQAQTVRNYVLAALLKLGGRAKVADIVVEAWKLAPARLSLPGYDYPDSHRVYMELVKLDKIDIVWVATSMYELTPAGRLRAISYVNQLAGSGAKSSARARA